MDINKDYYAILGVLPGIDEVALKAVYTALMKKFHPDTTKLNRKDAEEKAKEINEAYAVLSDPVKRADYDKARAETNRKYGDYRDDQTSSAAGFDDSQLIRDWEIVIEHYPECEKYRKYLYGLSSTVAKIFQIMIVSNKWAANSEIVAENLKQRYLSFYFGDSERIHRFVLELKSLRYETALLEISDYIRVIGTPSDGDVDKIILKFMSKYKIRKFEIYNLDAIEKTDEDVKLNGTSSSSQSLMKALFLTVLVIGLLSYCIPKY